MKHRKTGSKQPSLSNNEPDRAVASPEDGDLDFSIEDPTIGRIFLNTATVLFQTVDGMKRLLIVIEKEKISDDSPAKVHSLSEPGIRLAPERFESCLSITTGPDGEPVLTGIPRENYTAEIKSVATEGARAFPLEAEGSSYGSMIMIFPGERNSGIPDASLFSQAAETLASIIRFSSRIDDERRVQSELTSLWNIATAYELTAPNLIRRLLDGVREITSSRYACYAEIDDAGRQVLSFETCSETMKDCSMVSSTLSTGLPGNGIFEAVVNSGMPQIINDPDDPRLASVNLPVGHVEMHRLTVFPAIIRDGIVRAFLAVSGKDTEYTDADIGHVRTLNSGAQAILERMRIEKERDNMQEMFLQTQKLEAIGTLAGGVAHDFKNLLVAIRGFNDLTMMDLDESDFRYSNLEQINNAVAQASALTRQLLLFSEMAPLEKEAVDANEIIQNLYKMLKRIIGEDVKVNINLEKNPWIIQADPGNLEQLVMNLSVNAKEAMPGGGSLTIETKNVVVTEQEIEHIPNARTGEFFRLTVADTGEGMSKEVLGHIFEPFFSTKPSGKGTGLGLSVVYGIVTRHDGWLKVESEPGKGTCFRIHFPVFLHEAIDEVDKDAPADIQRGTGERILLVEDEDGVRTLAEKILSRNDYIVFTVESAEHALEIFKKENGRFDLLFSDVVLRGMTGVDLATELRSQMPGLKILLTSGYPTRKIQFEQIKRMGFKFLKKPYSLAGLLATVRKTIHDS